MSGKISVPDEAVHSLLHQNCHVQRRDRKLEDCESSKPLLHQEIEMIRLLADEHKNLFLLVTTHIKL